jgi:hypothetical protein
MPFLIRDPRPSSRRAHCRHILEGHPDFPGAPQVLETLVLAELNRNTADFSCSKPITLAFSQKVDEGLAEMPPRHDAAGGVLYARKDSNLRPHEANHIAVALVAHVETSGTRSGTSTATTLVSGNERHREFRATKPNSESSLLDLLRFHAGSTGSNPVRGT